MASVAPVAPRTVSRADFNRFAVRLNVPLFWAWRCRTSGEAWSEPRRKSRTLLFYPNSGSSEFERLRDAIVAFDPYATPSNLPTDELTRRRLVADDLDQGFASRHVTRDLRSSSPVDRKFFEHMLAAARSVDEIYATMQGAKALAARVPADDVASQSLFRRDWGPKCAGARTQKNFACSAIAGSPRPVSDAYPADMQEDPGFCAVLQKLPDAKTIVANPFGVVRERNGKLVNVPYTEAYAAPMRAVAAELRAAAADEIDPAESALRAYLEAAATSFTTNDWGPADEAWARMNAQNSRFYLRIAPDEVLNDPCNLKAQFHLNLARIDPGSVRWQSKITPHEEEMERTLAGLSWGALLRAQGDVPPAGLHPNRLQRGRRPTARRRDRRREPPQLGKSGDRGSRADGRDDESRERSR